MTRLLCALRTRLGPADRGAGTLWFAIFAFAFLMFAGLVVDYGGSLAAKHRAQIAANEAARAAGQAVVKPLGMRGLGVVVDPLSAQGAAQRYLASANVQGNVQPIAPRVLMVTTTETYDPKILSIIGIGTMQVTGAATVNLNHVGADTAEGSPDILDGLGNFIGEGGG